LVSSAFAPIEKTPRILGWDGLDLESTCIAILDAEIQLGVFDKLRGFTAVVNAISDTKHRSRKFFYNLVILNSLQNSVEIFPYSEKEFEIAAARYAESERRVISGEAIEMFLVSAGPINSLRKACPIFFLDADSFIRQVTRLIEVGTKARGAGKRKRLVIKKGQAYFDF